MQPWLGVGASSAVSSEAAHLAMPAPPPLLAPQRALAAQGGRTLVRREQQAVAALRSLPTSEWRGPPQAVAASHGTVPVPQQAAASHGPCTGTVIGPGSSAQDFSLGVEDGVADGTGAPGGHQQRGDEEVGEEVGEEVDLLCRICLEPFAIGQTLRWLPCTHRYHKHCADHWLLRTQRGQTRSCPLCKHDPLAGLSEEDE
jgi:hypothetical protein